MGVAAKQSGAGGIGGGGGWEKMRFSYGRRNVHSVKQNIKLYYRIKIPRGIFDIQCSSLMAYLQFKKLFGCVASSHEHFLKHFSRILFLDLF